MLRHHMVVITKDNRLKREVQRVTASTASSADFIQDLGALDNAQRAQRPHLVIYDARAAAPPPGLDDRLPSGCSVIYIIEEDNLIDGLSLLDSRRACSVMGYGARFDDDEFIASATKALRGNVFGLAKYFPWGVTTFSMVVASGAQKTKAIDVIQGYASAAGVRGPVRDRIQTVADELMMNALYHAPVDAQGKERFAGIPRKELSALPEVPAIEVSYGSSGRYFGIGVRDGGGSLTRDRAMKYLQKARGGGANVEQKVSGAGIGLVTTLTSVSKLVFDLQPGKSTEVIALFDLELAAKGKLGARSVHVFTARAEPEPDPEVGATPTPATSIAPQRRGMWIMVAILLSVATAMGTAVAMHRTRPAAAADPRCPPSGAILDDPAPPATPSSAAPTEPAPPPPRVVRRPR